ncbi:predicted protein [Naegleria gruberi]|uniref:Predicted protein n=1 Tax=Naegleria gruberi TaxID=5762 RepID=D2W6W0_NAEGR|nr:uncharacterized protein NAEGRDRAFT_77153 [Naegleria gruberi]EFC35192.1 predicted protein [Naegleria gruberi]|eukprot:XP_002667936.1 predicted protein [Naegleria gruberi strain NEG-M]
MCVSDKLGIPTELINISSANSNIIPNPISTCGSMGTDLFAGAALVACDILNQRLLPLKNKLFNENNNNLNENNLNENNKLSKKEWSELINYAYFNRICLSAIGYYKPKRTTSSNNNNDNSNNSNNSNNTSNNDNGEQTFNEETLKGNPQLYYWNVIFNRTIKL